MLSEFELYLGSVERRLHLRPEQERDILVELRDHLQERADDYRQQGMNPKLAFKQAVEDMGVPDDVARRMYDIHSGNSWRDAILAATPHLTLALLFAMHLWTRTAWVVVIVGMLALVSLQGWRRTKSMWLYPWLSYTLAIPILSSLAAMGAVAYGVWSLVQNGHAPLGIPYYILFGLYAPFALYITASMASKVVRRDWLLASLTATPLPVLMGWLLYIQDEGRGFGESPQQIGQTDGSTALVFLALAITTAVFLRVSQRLFRILLLITATPILSFFAYLTFIGSPGLLTLIVIIALCAVLLLGPALLDARASQSSPTGPPAFSRQ
ncbi:MAG: hypothetical protein C1O27_001632 [Chloroflexi bacterium]|jgi:hypothetical protein|nr:MAG: hypothetical protein C1O27_001632 [Chloroflexota bacterium]